MCNAATAAAAVGIDAIQIIILQYHASQDYVNIFLIQSFSQRTDVIAPETERERERERDRDRAQTNKLVSINMSNVVTSCYNNEVSTHSAKRD